MKLSKPSRKLDKSKQMNLTLIIVYRTSFDVERTLKRIKKLTIDDQHIQKQIELSERKKYQLTLPKLPKLEIQKKLRKLQNQYVKELDERIEKNRLNKYILEESIRHQRMLSQIEKIRRTTFIKESSRVIEKKIKQTDWEIQAQN